MKYHDTETRHSQVIPTLILFCFVLLFQIDTSSNCRVRALRALFSIAPGEFIEKLCNTSVTLIR